jgi:hypothetical protein
MSNIVLLEKLVSEFQDVVIEHIGNKITDVNNMYSELSCISKKSNIESLLTFAYTYFMCEGQVLNGGINQLISNNYNQELKYTVDWLNNNINLIETLEQRHKINYFLRQVLRGNDSEDLENEFLEIYSEFNSELQILMLKTFKGNK